MPLFYLDVVGKKAFDRPRWSSWLHHALSVFAWAKNLRSLNNVNVFVWKKKSEVGNVCPMGGLVLLIMVFFSFSSVFWSHETETTPVTQTKSSVIKMRVKWQRNSWVVEGGSNMRSDLTMDRDWTSHPWKFHHEVCLSLAAGLALWPGSVLYLLISFLTSGCSLAWFTGCRFWGDIRFLDQLSYLILSPCLEEKGPWLHYWCHQLSKT